ncbi:MAG: substrate-binding domain-containing protein [Planctomycetota bacterium]
MDSRRIAKIALLSVALAGLALAAVRVGVSVSMRNEPTVDLARRNGRVMPAPDATAHENSLRFAVATMVSAETTFTTYRSLVQRICRDVGRQEAFVLRPSYADVRRELEQGTIDVGFVCTGTYVHALPQGRIKLLAKPEFEDGLAYRCLLIVPAGSSRDSLKELRGAVMAFTDPESNTGCLVPQALLLERGYDPETFFSKTVFTKSHDRSIRSVALGVVDVAAVDSLVWKSNIEQDESLARRARVIWRSEAFGPPPIVVPAGIEPRLERSLRQAFLTLDQDEEGRAILSSIGIKRFVKANHDDYASAIALYSRCRARRDKQ